MSEEYARNPRASMPAAMRISSDVQRLLRCPVCYANLTQSGGRLDCTGASCAAQFPMVDGIPVLLNEQSSVFTIDDFVSHRKTFFDEGPADTVTAFLRGLTPTISANIKGKANYRKLGQELLGRSGTPRVLLIGGSILGQGMESLAENAAFDLVESDVSLGPRTAMICDAHDIPFQDESFDGVIIQAVLEHVADPYRCCDEVHRVLKKEGVVYAETPFMQQVHGGRYDFMRFTHLGHRRLFRRFSEIESGAVCGPGMALSWSWQYFLLSFTTAPVLRVMVRALARLTSFWLKYADYLLIDTPGSLDAASGYYFMGRKSEQTLSDRDLIGLYKGAG